MDNYTFIVTPETKVITIRYMDGTVIFIHVDKISSVMYRNGGLFVACVEDAQGKETFQCFDEFAQSQFIFQYEIIFNVKVMGEH